jgi:DNA-binding GntR family transcriptional regulator
MVELVSHSGSLAMPIPKSVAQVRALLANRIINGLPGYRPGDKLPSYDVLVEQLPAARATVYRAIKLLKDDGLVVGLRGGGVWVAERTTDG